MTRILVQRGSTSGSSSNASRSSSLTGSSSGRVESQGVIPQHSALKDEEPAEEMRVQTNIVDELLVESENRENKTVENDDLLAERIHNDQESLCNEIEADDEKVPDDDIWGSRELLSGLKMPQISERLAVNDVGLIGSSSKIDVSGSSHPPPPPPPVPPPTSSAVNSNSRKYVTGSSNAVHIGSPRRAVGRPVVLTRTSPTGSRPSSPRSHVDYDGYNSADEQNSCFVSSYDDFERERQFEVDIKRAKGLEVRRMLEDGNCLFRAVADQVYGDSEVYDLVRQMCIDYMERERDHFSQFITEGFTSYCKRKRRDKVYGNNMEIQALAEMYNRPIHIYSYGTEPINIFHGTYDTDTPPIRLSYHRGNHYNSLLDPRRVAVGAGLGFSSLQGTNVDKDQVKAAIKEQQDQLIDNALLAEGRFYSDLELTEKEIERMVMEASRAEYIVSDVLKQQVGHRDSSSGAEPSSSGARSSGNETKRERGTPDSVLSSSMQMVLSMGFSYLQVIEAYSIFGDDVDSMVCYLLETGSSSRRKGKATE